MRMLLRVRVMLLTYQIKFCWLSKNGFKYIKRALFEVVKEVFGYVSAPLVTSAFTLRVGILL